MAAPAREEFPRSPLDGMRGLIRQAYRPLVFPNPRNVGKALPAEVEVLRENTEFWADWERVDWEREADNERFRAAPSGGIREGE